ncbi:hypothetical protein [Frankia sp. AiPa1]|nr:hypothetical protein [Frankia sp. AiPa1]MCL9758122.1 hypothetical protein [Frankia sp. AiPa1]
MGVVGELVEAGDRAGGAAVGLVPAGPGDRGVDELAGVDDRDGDLVDQRA